MKAITARELHKTYHTRVKEKGLKASLKALIKPEYQNIDAVSGLDITVERGEILAFIGKNGAGKSTTIKMMTGILHPTSGDISVLGLNPAKQRQLLSYRIGTVFGQKSQLWFHLPPSDSFELLATIYDIDSATFQKRQSELVERFELGELLKTPVRKLSLGQRVRCEVAASLLHAPEIIFLDEPTIGLDVIVKRQIRELLLEYNRESGATIFLTSHDTSDIEQLCRRAVVIDRGAIVLDQPVNMLKHNFLSQKIISVRLTNEISIPPMDGVSMIESGGVEMKLSVDTSKNALGEIMQSLCASGYVEDITVNDPPMEDIIASIFREKGAVK